MCPKSNCFEALDPVTLAKLKAAFDRTEGMVSFDEAVLLYQLAAAARDGCIVEVGSYRGRSSVFLGKGSLDGSRAPVFAIDPHRDFIGVLGGVFGPQDRTAFYRSMLDNECSEIVALINLSSECFAAAWQQPVSLLWIDGDHSYAGVSRDFNCWLPHLNSSGLIAFDDATDPKLGPRRLVDELTTSGDFDEILNVGKVAVIRKTKIG